MDPDHAFLRVHARLSGVLSQLLTPRVRFALEYLSLAFALSVLWLLVVMHANFVHQPGCSSELSGVELGEAQLVLIKIRGGGLWAQNAADKSIVDSQKQGGLAGSFVTSDVNGDEPPLLSTTFWANWIGSGARRSKLIFKSWKNYKEYSEPRAEMNTDERGGLHKGFPVSFEESFKAAVVRLCDKWNICVSSLWKIGKRFSRNAGELRETAGWKVLLQISKFFKLLHIKHLNSSIMQWLERRSKAFEPTYLFTAEKGYFLLPEGAKARYDIQTFNITISAQNSCFGNRWHRFLINTFIGYDTILMNSLLSYPGQGYLYNFQTKEFYDLNYGHGLSEGPARFGDYIVTKCGVLIMSLFVFFTTTMSVSFIIRETQSRMLKFTVQLQRHAHHQLPTFQLIFVHVTDSLVFVPIMIGILFFLFEFYDDQLLAFLVLTLLLLCEFFKLISVRTSISMQFFPRFVLLYFLVFHIYFFSHASGFSYLAFSATTAFMQHLILCFWNCFEVPALQRFVRAQAQRQEAGVQITSSTIYTSTIHISRVNVRNANSNNNEMEPRFELPSTPDHARSNDPLLPAESTGTRGQLAGGSLDSTRSSLQSTALNPQHQMETTHGSILLHPFNSFRIWILGGASSDGIISFFSMFRDIGDQGQDYRESPPQDTEPIT